MSDEQHVGAGSETSSESVIPPVETTTSETPAAEVAAEQNVGDPCTCLDGRAGTLQPGAEDGTLVCVANHQG